MTDFMKNRMSLKTKKELSHNFGKHPDMILKEELLDYAENLLNRRRKKIKLDRYEEILTKLDPVNNYEIRNDYLEKSINDAMKYYSPTIMFKTEKDE